MAIIDRLAFVKAWMTLDTIEKVARKFDVTPAQASAKANNLRTIGVRLPHKKPAPSLATVDDLNRIIEKYQNGESE
jgi:hypothetical protein